MLARQRTLQIHSMTPSEVPSPDAGGVFVLAWQAEQHSAQTCATHKVELFPTLSMFWHTCQEGYDCCAAPYCCDHEGAAQSADGKTHNICSINVAPRFAA